MGEAPLRLYHDLAWLWPLWEDPDEYGPEGEHAAALVRRYSQIPAQTLLDMGCGGGKNAFHLKRHFAVTGIGLSQEMLEHARRLNPECAFLMADMRSCQLDTQFDCVLVDDAITGMNTRADFAAVLQTAFRHLRPGGVMITGPDDTTETFEQNRTRVSTASSRFKPDNLEVVFVENQYDPDPTDEATEFTVIYLIREDGKLRIETDGGVDGLFPLEVWRSTLRETGFEVHEECSPVSPSGAPTFACVKPGAEGR